MSSSEHVWECAWVLIFSYHCKLSKQKVARHRSFIPCYNDHLKWPRHAEQKLIVIKYFNTWLFRSWVNREWQQPGISQQVKLWAAWNYSGNRHNYLWLKLECQHKHTYWCTRYDSPLHPSDYAIKHENTITNNENLSRTMKWCTTTF